MFSAEKFEMRKHLLTLSLAKLRYNSEASLKACWLFIYGDMLYITNSFRKVCKK
jgi:hypothetical protein